MTPQLMMIYHQTKFDYKRFRNSADIQILTEILTIHRHCDYDLDHINPIFSLDILVYDYIRPPYDLDLEPSKLYFSCDTLPLSDAPP